GGHGAAAGAAAGVRGQALVDDAVAVVVLAVARLDGAVLRPGAQLVVGVGRIVGARAHVADALVDLSVAVVVLAVADLGGRGRRGDDADDRRFPRRRVGERDLDGAARAARDGDVRVEVARDRRVRDDVGLHVRGAAQELAGLHLRLEGREAGLRAGLVV